MAEFAQVMKDWRRMCKAYTSNCDKCPLCNLECGAVPRNIKYHTDGQIEAIVKTWAAKHPEPKYPTWWKYLCMIGLIPDSLGYKTLGEVTVEQLMNTEIPADIAQKLGLEPKEVR